MWRHKYQVVKPFLKKNSCFLPFLGEKCKKCQQKAAKCLCHILRVQHKKIPIFNVFWQFLILVKSNMAPHVAAILNDVTGPPATRQPIICTSSCRAHHRLSIKGGIFSKYCNITKTQGGPLIPPPLYHGEGVTQCLYVRGIIVCGELVVHPPQSCGNHTSALDHPIYIYFFFFVELENCWRKKIELVERMLFKHVGIHVCSQFSTGVNRN